eukprot:TRINITY_DN33545_c0_g1_i1.p2 TRINITY_DN33545_c0_g1~~TRINITY_DN33545_c0_g1_i1.p2  ORF type:complete len:209 (+),score=57.45 TRINITY_DN33545_c0_g1_i1:257-883(+)
MEDTQPQGNDGATNTDTACPEEQEDGCATDQPDHTSQPEADCAPPVCEEVAELPEPAPEDRMMDLASVVPSAGWTPWDYFKAGTGVALATVGAVTVACGVAKAAKRLSDEQWAVEWDTDEVTAEKSHNVHFTLRGPVSGAEVVYTLLDGMGRPSAQGSVCVGERHAIDTSYCKHWPLTLQATYCNSPVVLQNADLHKVRPTSSHAKHD